jgi:methionine-rich copper-binding protein CopC
MRAIRHLVAAAIAGSFLGAVPALAHPKLLSSTPTANGAAQAPTQVSLAFSEKLMAQLSGLDIVMTGMPGMPNHRMAVTDYKVTTSDDGKTLVASFARPLSAGSYQVKWHVVSADTHRVEGDFAFSVP